MIVFKIIRLFFRRVAAHVLVFLILASLCHAGPYRDSAHGDTDEGVHRLVPGVSSPGPYITGNCAHCHEQHASMGGQEPVPQNSGPSPFALFAPPFDSGRRFAPYQAEDVFCFYCHSGASSLQRSASLMENYDYSRNFGGLTGGPNNIIEAFNQPLAGLSASYHNLYDIWNHSQRFNFFKASSTPCSACHNAHRARQNREHPQNPDFTAISLPTDHESLWGDDAAETMATYNGEYEHPLYAGPSGGREPAGVGAALADGSQVPDYNRFCLDCHAEQVYSSTLSRQIPRIDWSTTGGDTYSAGDKHGRNTYTTEILVQAPYDSAMGINRGFVLSCLDCHEPHGAPNAYLIRRGANGSALMGQVTGNAADNSMGHLCRQCHKDDYAQAGGGDSQLKNRWYHVHHESQEAPYTARRCATCHPMGGGMGTQPPIGCGYCHGHGMTIDATTPGTLPSGQTIPAPNGGTRKAF